MSNDDRLKHIRQQLDADSEQLPEETRQRLRQIRAAAVSRAGRREIHPWLLPAGSLALAAGVGFLAVSLWLTPAPELKHDTPDLLQDMEMLSSNDELDMYEDLDFYLWLETENNAS